MWSVPKNPSYFCVTLIIESWSLIWNYWRGYLKATDPNPGRSNKLAGSWRMTSPSGRSIIGPDLPPNSAGNNRPLPLRIPSSPMSVEKLYVQCIFFKYFYAVYLPMPSRLSESYFVLKRTSLSLFRPLKPRTVLFPSLSISLTLKSLRGPAAPAEVICFCWILPLTPPDFVFVVVFGDVLTISEYCKYQIINLKSRKNQND